MVSSAPEPPLAPPESVHDWSPVPPLPSPQENAVATAWLNANVWLSAGEVIDAVGGCS